MLWTFVGFNLILGALLVHFLKKVIDTVTKNYYVYPSEAVIDQTLPAEIMEHMMTFLDPAALIKCRLVSKYWRHHATKSQVENSILDAYDRQMKLTKLPYAGTKNLSYEPIWLDEPNYPQRFLLRDRALATKHGKQLLEISPSWLNIVLQAFNTDNSLGDNKTVDMDKFIIKTFASKGNLNEPPDRISINVGQRQDIRFAEHTVPYLDWKSLDYYAYLDCMFDLADCFDQTKRDLVRQRVYSVRDANPKKYFWFVPLNSDILKVLAFIFVPLIVHDVLYSEFLATVKIWFGPIMFLLNLVANVMMVLEFTGWRAMEPIYKKAAAIFWTGFVVLSLLAYPYSLTYYAVVGMVALTVIYTVLMFEYTFHWNAKLTWRRAAPALIALALVVTLNDWKLTVDSIRTGAILFRWFDNSVCYALMCINMIALNCITHITPSKGWEWKYLIEWNQQVAHDNEGVLYYRIFNIVCTYVERKSPIANWW